MKRWAASFVAAAALLMLVATPGTASARGVTYVYWCPSYSTWTDPYSGMVVHYRPCFRAFHNLGTNTDFLQSVNESYVTSVTSQAVDPYWAVGHLVSPAGVSQVLSCGRSGVPTSMYECDGPHVTAVIGTIWTSKANVCLFFTSGPTDCSPTVSYNHAA
jgi:hypothetical protein